MKNNKKLVACLLACALMTVPLAACSRNGHYTDKPDSDIGWIEDDDQKDPPVSGDTDADASAPVKPPQQDGDGNDTDISTPSTDSITYIHTKTNGLNIRSGPGTSYASLGTIESGVLLKFDGKVGDFYKTVYLNRTAYVSANPSYTTLTAFDLAEVNDDIERVIEEGLKVLGTKYVYGATRYHYGNGSRVPGFKITEFDCSSLMQYIFYQGANELLDMNSRSQSLQGKAVDRSDLKRGDLMFFTNASRKDKVGIERIGHVALYLGQNYILHTASDYAKVEQISSTRWGYYISARRIID